MHLDVVEQVGVAGRVPERETCSGGDGHEAAGLQEDVVGRPQRAAEETVLDPDAICAVEI